MAFFDDLGKKLSQAGQTAAQKTKEIAEIAKLNSMISDEERKANECYSQIGKLYVSLHDADYEASFEELFTALHDAETKVRDYQKQIKDIKGVVKCEKCGAEVSNTSAFCSSCGAPLPVAEAPAQNTENTENTENNEQ